jgi:hypothetical protein
MQKIQRAKQYEKQGFWETVHVIDSQSHVPFWAVLARLFYHTLPVPKHSSFRVVAPNECNRISSFYRRGHSGTPPIAAVANLELKQTMLRRPDQTACIPVNTGSTYTCCTHV